MNESGNTLQTFGSTHNIIIHDKPVQFAVICQKRETSSVFPELSVTWPMSDTITSWVVTPDGVQRHLFRYDGYVIWLNTGVYCQTQ